VTTESATTLGRLYRARKVSPLEVMQAVLARIDALNPRVNAYVTVAREAARWEPVMQKGLVWNIKQGLAPTPQQIGHGEKLRTRLWQRVRAFMETRELLILPTVAIPPFPLEQAYPTEINGRVADNYTQWFFLTYGITVTGLPVISVPCGFTKSGLPVGLQIVGRRRQEAAVLRAGA
jgi:Asp-tRNA(Asn)/Glu-tRNA(Gln) amidotransferase A subunit family amidase